MLGTGEVPDEPNPPTQPCMEVVMDPAEWQQAIANAYSLHAEMEDGVKLRASFEAAEDGDYWTIRDQLLAKWYTEDHKLTSTTFFLLAEAAKDW